jgi:hypothetical protein
MTNIDSVVPSSARPDSAIISMTRQRHYIMANVASAMPSPVRLGSDITPWQHCLGSIIVSMTWQWHHVTTNIGSVVPSLAWLESLACTFSTSNLTRRITVDQVMGLKEYHSNWHPNSGTLVPTSPILNRGECVVTNKIMWHFIKSAKSYL